MQFKQIRDNETSSLKRVQIMKYQGYDKEKKRGHVKMIGYLKVPGYTPSAGLFDTMTDDEKKETESYISEGKAKEDQIKHLDTICVGYLYLSQLETAIKIAENPPVSDVEKIYNGIALLTKALRKAGFKKPLKPKKVTKDESSLGPLFDEQNQPENTGH